MQKDNNLEVTLEELKKVADQQPLDKQMNLLVLMAHCLLNLLKNEGRRGIGLINHVLCVPYSINKVSRANI